MGRNDFNVHTRKDHLPIVAECQEDQRRRLAEQSHRAGPPVWDGPLDVAIGTFQKRQHQQQRQAAQAEPQPEPDSKRGQRYVQGRVAHEEVGDVHLPRLQGHEQKRGGEEQHQSEAIDAWLVV